MQLKADPTLMRMFLAAEEEYHDAQRQLCTDAMKSSPYQKGDIVRDLDTGARYRIENATAWVKNGRVTLALNGTRVYTTGRRDARTSSHIYSDRLEKVVDTAAAPS